jgi:hypothetical protein
MIHACGLCARGVGEPRRPALHEDGSPTGSDGPPEGPRDSAEVPHASDVEAKTKASIARLSPLSISLKPNMRMFPFLYLSCCVLRRQCKELEADQWTREPCSRRSLPPTARGATCHALAAPGTQRESVSYRIGGMRKKRAARH